jgi:hypothetical protein
MNVTESRPSVLNALQSYHTLNTNKKTTHILVCNGDSWSVKTKPTGFLSWLSGLFESKEKRKAKVNTLLNKLLRDLTHLNENKQHTFTDIQTISEAAKKIVTKTCKHTDSELRRQIDSQANQLCQAPSKKETKGRQAIELEPEITPSFDSAMPREYVQTSSFRFPPNLPLRNIANPDDIYKDFTRL